MSNVTVILGKDTATPRLQQLQVATSPDVVRRAVGGECVRLAQRHLIANGINKRGWPSAGFYTGAARGTSWDATPEGIKIYIDNEAKPGAMRQRYHGGTIKAKDRLLTIPAQAQFYGHSATEFTNLRFVKFKSGAMALIVNTRGAGRVNFATGREHNVSGAGARSAGMVAYWLKEEVTQQGDPSIIPTQDEFASAAIDAVVQLVGRAKR